MGKLLAALNVVVLGIAFVLFVRVNTQPEVFIVGHSDTHGYTYTRVGPGWPLRAWGGTMSGGIEPERLLADERRRIDPRTLLTDERGLVDPRTLLTDNRLTGSPPASRSRRFRDMREAWVLLGVNGIIGVYMLVALGLNIRVVFRRPAPCPVTQVVLPRAVLLDETYGRPRSSTLSRLGWPSLRGPREMIRSGVRRSVGR